MCTTFYIDVEESELRKICREIEENQKIHMKSGKVYPKYLAPVLMRQNDVIKARAMNWGVPAKWAKGNSPLVNTRLETALEKKTWKDSILHRRILIPMAGFYEWKTEADSKKKLFYFQNPDSSSLYAAGIYDIFEPEGSLLSERFSMITTEPNDSVREIHDRMPLILGAEEQECWLAGAPVDIWMDAARTTIPLQASTQ